MNPESTFGMRRPVNHLGIARCEIQWQSKLCITFSIAPCTFTCRIIFLIRSFAIFYNSFENNLSNVNNNILEFNKICYQRVLST